MTLHVGHCPKNGKRMFGSERAAKRGVKNVHNRIRIYFCDHCHAYHATSQDAQ